MMVIDNSMDGAITWLVRLSDGATSGADWAAFTAWLEADPAHASAYDTLAHADADLATALLLDQSADNDNDTNDNDSDSDIVAPRWFMRRAVMAIAASVALALIASPLLLSGRGLESIETRPGETLQVALADGSQIILNGGTRIGINRKSARFARLESGEAVFTIRHDPDQPFEVEAGGATLRDIGTVFNVRHDQNGLDVTVAQGAVQFDPHGAALTIKAGQQLVFSGKPGPTVISTIDARSVGGWRTGLLTYRGASLGRIANDLTRSLGCPVMVAPDLVSRRFSGTIRVEQDQKLQFHRLESLLGVRATHSDKGWQLTS
jgi:transmembrane sensor